MKKIALLTLLAITTISVKAQTPFSKHLIKYLEINTTQSDYGVAFSGEDKLVFTTPKNEGSKSSQIDLFVGDINEEGEITNKEPIKGIKELSKVSKTGMTYSQDFKTVYFSAKKDKRKKSKENEKLFKATVDASGNWTNIQSLPFNSKKHSNGQPSLSKDGKKLYFTSNRPSSYGGTDIFVVTINDNGTYGEPTNLGDKINTIGNEVTPYISDKNMLFFSSDGHKNNLGNLDVYASEIFDNSTSESFHLEAPINSINDDFAYIINKNNDAGYFSSNRLQGQDNNDIYSFIIEEIKPEKCIQEIAGIVKDKETQEVLNDAAMTLFDEEGNQIQQVVTDENGAYNFTLDCSETYTLVASSLYYVKEEHIINTANYNNAPTLEANKFLIKMSESELAAAKATEVIVEEVEETPVTEVEEVETIKEEVVVEENETEAPASPVYFGFDRSDITEAAATELDKLVTIMNSNTTLKIKVSSYTDSRGSSAYNLKLSNRRAQSTVDYLVAHGIDISRITAKGYGEVQMVNKCVNGVECSETAHSKNRRTEFNFVN